MAVKSKTTKKPCVDPRPPSQIALEVINDTIDTWKKENTPAVIREKALRILEENNKEILIKLLGFNDTWGRFELDHCNGRAGESAAGKYLADQQRIVVQEWLSQVELPTLSAADKKEMMASAKQDYLYVYRKQLSDIVRAAAQRDAEAAFKELAASTLLDNIDRTKQLLDI